jgi:hypothetical protein
MKSEIKIKQQGFWRSHSEAWKDSGLTQKAYCEGNEISYGSFVYQHNRIVRQEEKRNPIKFIERKTALQKPALNTSRLQLILPNGIRMGIEGDMSGELLETVLRVAGGITC